MILKKKLQACEFLRLVFSHMQAILYIGGEEKWLKIN